MELSKAIQAIIDNPEDLSTLPQLVAKAQEMETKVQDFTEIEQGYQEKITKMQEYSRSLLAQIPIPEQEPKPPENKPEEPTFEQAQEELLKAMQNVGGN